MLDLGGDIETWFYYRGVEGHHSLHRSLLHSMSGGLNDVETLSRYGPSLVIERFGDGWQSQDGERVWRARIFIPGDEALG